MDSLVSIITPYYNSEDYISNTIESVISQSYTDWEMLIVDDCSTVKSFEALKRYSKKDSRIKVFKNNKNSGPAITRNNAIKHADGRYIAFLDSDDIWFPDKIARQIDYMKMNDVYFTYSYYQKINDKGEVLNDIIRPPGILDYKSMLRSNFIGTLTAMYDTKYLGKHFMPEKSVAEDYGLWLSLLKDSKTAHCIPEVLAYYRVTPNSFSSNKAKYLRLNWRLFRNVESFSIPVSLYYLVWNSIYSVLPIKYRKKSINNR